MGRCTKAQANKRVAVVMRMLLRETPRAEIVQYASEKWDIGERQTDSYIRKATEQIKKDIERKRKSGVDYRLAKRNHLFQTAFNKGRLGLCFEIEKDIAKLEGLYVEKVDVNQNTNLSLDLGHLEDEELDDKINMLSGGDDDSDSDTD